MVLLPKSGRRLPENHRKNTFNIHKPSSIANFVLGYFPENKWFQAFNNSLQIFTLDRKWHDLYSAFSALTLLVGYRKGIRPVKKLNGGMLAWSCVWVKVQISIWPS